ncbi:MAG TPA: type I-E CRISPR-associated protein Cas6/Cse3/CasE [Eoetvoesiella sp.]|uniref:type I-E CRISPR-associated protein Cas6/Cse3/CasE n=1 Tax=Eoetvoesiella sp. TaxID=1966355 RepID=UPI002D0F3D2F|nr:type I-E CRISPR-associated protein Cas6/Cse3/CasE [Eoetvoesiella sp.]HWK60821.1 type I-E CRISPR-associated protein Cas6/Cse3/CasE [Eoetvoesiella sp.]
MYLTRLTLDSRSAQARRDLASPYDMHRTLVRAFAVDGEQTPPRFLWRLEPQVSWGTPPVLLVQSSHTADWQFLQVEPNYLKLLPETKMLDLGDWMQPLRRYRFRLFANPTVSRDGKRYGLASEVDQLAWLSRQGERHGFELESAVVMASDMLKTHKRDIGISLQRACYEGVLAAADITRLAAAVEGGIGPGKAFGFGLLSLAEIRH